MSIDLPGSRPDALYRRRFVTGMAVGGLAAGLGLWRLPALADSGRTRAMNGLTGTDFDLSIGHSQMNFTGRTRPAITVNGSLPAPLARRRHGDGARGQSDA